MQFSVFKSEPTARWATRRKRLYAAAFLAPRAAAEGQRWTEDSRSRADWYLLTHQLRIFPQPFVRQLLRLGNLFGGHLDSDGGLEGGCVLVLLGCGKIPPSHRMNQARGDAMAFDVHRTEAKLRLRIPLLGR